MKYNNDFFWGIQEFRKCMSKWLIILNPALITFIVFVFDIDLVSFLLSFFPEIKNKIVSNPRLILTLNTVLLTVLANLFVNLFKSPGELKIKLMNNSRKNNFHFSSDALHRTHHIHLDGSIEFKSIALKWFFLKFINLKIQIRFPDWIDIEIDNEPSVSKYVDSPKDRIHRVLVNSLFSQEAKSKKEYYIHYMVKANAPHQENDNIAITLVASKWGLILVALFFDTKIEDYQIEMRTN